LDSPGEVDYSQSIVSKKNLAWRYMNKALQQLWKKRSPWLHWKISIITVAEARREGRIIMRPQKGAILDEHSENQRRAVRQYNEKGNNWHLQENPYDR
jgi:hypothetical protein